MAGSRPIIVHGNNIIFSNRFKYSSNGKPITEIYELEYLITPFGLFLPTDISEQLLIKYLKDPSQDNRDKIFDFSYAGYLVTPLGDLISLTISTKTKHKLFLQSISTGPGVKAIHNTNGKVSENPATILFGTDSFEQFMDVYRRVYDPHGFTICMKIDEIVELLKSHDVTGKIHQSGLALADENDV